MKTQRHLLSDLWENTPIAVAGETIEYKEMPLGKYLAEMLSIGPFYYYVINVADNSIHQIHENLLPILGAKAYPKTVKDIIDYIHPNDLEFVFEAEKATLVKMESMGFGKGRLFRTSYCFRMRTADGSYRLFHHQGIHLGQNDAGRITTALNIHTDIHHITDINNKLVLIKAIGERDYCQVDLSQTTAKRQPPELSRREMEILRLLAQGFTSQQIAESLFISPQTVRVHRKNLLKKTESSNSGCLIKKSIEFGLL
ncbi:LuxR C-terminal-related transcriptional regulator [Sphingobacterium thalpophilum]|uniref:LuxR C-terminal-related transcriptional regulator n=1 Tax=Sphingobacterium thalpophilum TaxID=259 RepID=A0ABV4H8A0_9SPHI|nr:LuxR C-terminal-related transcriptional regulator [Sphingobacterium thalpophilum]